MSRHIPIVNSCKPFIQGQISHRGDDLPSKQYPLADSIYLKSVENKREEDY